MVLICKNGLWRVYNTPWVGLGLWGRCVPYVRENCASYARKKNSYKMYIYINIYCILICQKMYVHFEHYTLYYITFFVKFPNVFLWIKVVKTLSWSIYFAIWANGNAKNIFVALSHSLPSKFTQLWRLPLLEPGNVKKVYVTSFYRNVATGTFFLSLAFDVKTNGKPNKSSSVYVITLCVNYTVRKSVCKPAQLILTDICM